MVYLPLFTYIWLRFTVNAGKYTCKLIRGVANPQETQLSKTWKVQTCFASQKKVRVPREEMPAICMVLRECDKVKWASFTHPTFYVHLVTSFKRQRQLPDRTPPTLYIILNFRQYVRHLPIRWNPSQHLIVSESARPCCGFCLHHLT